MTAQAMQAALILVALYYALKHPQRAGIAALLAAINTAHWYIFDGADDVTYYVSACTADVLSAMLIMQARTNLALDVSSLCIVSAAANIAGLIMWYAYMSPSLYNVIIQLILGLTVARLLMVMHDDMEGTSGIYRWRDMVRCHCLPCVGGMEARKN